MQKVLTSMMLRSVAFSGRPSAVLGRMGVGGGPLAGTGEGAEWEILVRPLVSVPRREYVRWRGGSTHWQRGEGNNGASSRHVADQSVVPRASSRDLLSSRPCGAQRGEAPA